MEVTQSFFRDASMGRDQRIAKDILDLIVDRSWEPFVDVNNIKPDLSEEEIVANFFLGFFPDIDDPEDLALELSAFFEDLQVYARAKRNKQIVNFCEFFADNANQLAEDLLKAKASIKENIQRSIDVGISSAKEIAKKFEEASEIHPEDQIKETRVRFANGVGVFRRSNNIDQDLDYEFVREGPNAERNQENDNQE